MSFSISNILENICIAQVILENMKTTQDALSGTGDNVYSFTLMFRPPGLHGSIIGLYKESKVFVMAEGDLAIERLWWNRF